MHFSSAELPVTISGGYLHLNPILLKLSQKPFSSVSRCRISIQFFWGSRPIDPIIFKGSYLRFCIHGTWLSDMKQCSFVKEVHEFELLSPTICPTCNIHANHLIETQVTMDRGLTSGLKTLLRFQTRVTLKI